MQIYMIHGKHESPLFETAVGAVKYQIAAVYQYEDEELLAEARRIVESGDERAALSLLRSRDGWEYEGFSIETVLP